MMKNVSLRVRNLVSRLLVLVLLAMPVLAPPPAMAAVTLDVMNPLARFTFEGGQSFSASPTVLSINDAAISDIANFYAPDPDAAAGDAIDIFAAFLIRAGSLSGATLGVHLVINDGTSKAVVAACIVQGGVKGIGLAAGTHFDDPNNYPVFVPVDWSRPTTVRIRRTADGDGEIVAVNGIAPSPRALLPSGQLAPRNRVVSTFEFGATSPEATVNVEFTQFFTERPSIVPVNGTPPTLTPITINNSTGDQYDPHISGDWVSYTSDLSIRYYSFATNTDAEIPMGASSRDLLSDISGSKIVFSRVTAVKTEVMMFDAATHTVAPIEIAPANGTISFGEAIGGNTVAYIDYGLDPHGELVIHDLNTSISTRITNDAAFDQNPSVSPDGNVVTWEHAATSTTNGDVWQAVKSGPLWNVSVVSNTTNPESNPDTNGTLVVYDSFRGGNGDLFLRPVTGGAEVQLQMPSYEANPSIAGNFIAFESRPTIFDTSDIFVYNIVTNLLYQITNTPLVTEQLNDITVLPDGRIRVVWSSDEDGFDQRNIHAATFSLPSVTPSPTELLQQLIDLVAQFNLRRGIANSLDAKLENAQAALAAARSGDSASACGMLGAFINEVQAQSGNALTTEQATQLINLANQVRAGLSCP